MHYSSLQVFTSVWFLFQKQVITVAVPLNNGLSSVSTTVSDLYKPISHLLFLSAVRLVQRDVFKYVMKVRTMPQRIFESVQALF